MNAESARIVTDLEAWEELRISRGLSQQIAAASDDIVGYIIADNVGGLYSSRKLNLAALLDWRRRPRDFFSISLHSNFVHALGLGLKFLLHHRLARVVVDLEVHLG